MFGPRSGEKSFDLLLLIECKKSEKPLLILSDDIEKERFSHLIGGLTTEEENAGIILASHLLHTQSDTEKFKNIGPFSEKTTSGYSIVTAFSKSDENIYKGLMGLTKADDFYREQHIKYFKEDKNHFQLQIPILVVDSPLYMVSLNKDNDISIVPVEWSNITIRVPWGKIEDKKCNIQIIQKDKFEDVISNIEKLFAYISDEEVMHTLIKKYELLHN